MLTRAQFDAACKALIHKQSQAPSKSVAAFLLRGWCWHEHPHYPNFGYMSRTVNVLRRLDNLAATVDESIDDVVSEESDPSTANMTVGPDQILTCEQHVVFSATFRVPAFYFTVHSATSGAPLSLPEVLQSTLFKIGTMDGFEVTPYAASLPASAFPVLSHGDHPTLNVPCWYFHPCETASVIDELVREAQKDDDWDEQTILIRWLELWFMVVSSVVNL
ncbi:hypothetical protein AGABI1DRAFT_128028 [Agaricus bisporus var. burnettii JB137-S8]|uniref:Ubiquitin-like-conjugating enzyme ATG10 n=1 Tax=Agaricus bisporus var. burnettii (strain JB137-S8 / ATCC MYA-4627 / FGSC 10392) TaxID=597362 RepID=K5WXW5_AGABU|nr:uncharacterized protein AGABI1DRAFT_128028 [Agaricus bisporus var. burnettii JB137-S8]EKM80356.1 hypothetical protein AGABI1DRAFT_128028 [Agaricus bisporus var. burnettii JB137-S8]